MSVERIGGVEAGPASSMVPAGFTTYKLAREYRRSAVYVLIGIVVLPFVAWLARDALAHDRLAVAVVFYELFAVVPIGLLRWRIRVDDRGIARRRLVRWELFPWSEFASGAVREGGNCETFVFPGRLPWNRTLCIGLLEPDDCKQLAAVIRRVWARPTAADLPVDLVVRYRFRRQILISPHCLVVTRRGEETHYRWSEVRELRIRRLERDRRDFVSVELDLPDETIKLIVSRPNGQTVRSWRGPSGSRRPTEEEIAGLLERYVPGERIVVTSFRGAPACRREWQDRMNLLDREGKELRALGWIMWGMGPVFLGLAFSEIGRGWFAALKLLVLSGVMWSLFLAVLRSLVAEHRTRRAELETSIRAPNASSN